MPDPFANYDAWLEAPIQRAYERADAFAAFCEREDYDPDTELARQAWSDFQAEERERTAEDQLERVLDRDEQGE